MTTAASSASTDDSDNPEPPRVALRRRWPLRLLAKLTWVCVIVLAVALLAAYVVPLDFHTEHPDRQKLQAAIFMTRVFQWHLGLAALLAAVVGLGLWRWRLLVVSLLVAGACMAGDLRHFLPKSSPVVEAGAPLFRVAAMNLYYANQDLDRIEAEVRRMDADVITFVEFTPWHNQQLRPRLESLYPYVFTEPGGGAGGKAIFSKYRLYKQWDHPNSARNHRRRVAINLGGGRLVAIYGVHHTSPQATWAVSANYEQSAELAEDLSHEQLPAVFMGDFNVTPMTPQLALLREKGLRAAHDLAGSGRGATWPNRRLLRHLPGVRIDHIFVSPELTVLATGVGEATGSDHWPVWADVTWAASESVGESSLD